MKMVREKIICQVCGNLAPIQHLSKNYFRCQHYIAMNPLTHRPMFMYHQQKAEYASKELEKLRSNSSIRSSSIENSSSTIEKSRSSGSISIDLEKVLDQSDQENKSGLGEIRTPDLWLVKQTS
jgi:hypothetical protein